VSCTFTAFHRGGSGSPLLCLHGFFDTWRSWELVLPRLERRHDVLAVTLAGHAGGPPVGARMTDAVLADAVEQAMEQACLQTAHIVGNSLGGFVALQLATRGRARTVVAMAPAGGWAPDDDSDKELLGFQRSVYELSRNAAPHAESILSSHVGRRRFTQLITTNFKHIPVELLAHMLRGVAACSAAEPMIEYARRAGWSLDAEKVTCPVRVVWGGADHLLPWPRAAARYRDEWLPQADWVVLDDVGHAPQLDVPLEAAELILGFTSP
jgi:pimeloyl-ACP methyl ester carboxylesterase